MTAPRCVPYTVEARKGVSERGFIHLHPSENKRYDRVMLPSGIRQRRRAAATPPSAREALVSRATEASGTISAVRGRTAPRGQRRRDQGIRDRHRGLRARRGSRSSAGFHCEDRSCQASRAPGRVLRWRRKDRSADHRVAQGGLCSPTSTSSGWSCANRSFRGWCAVTAPNAPLALGRSGWIRGCGGSRGLVAPSTECANFHSGTAFNKLEPGSGQRLLCRRPHRRDHPQSVDY